MGRISPGSYLLCICAVCVCVMGLMKIHQNVLKAYHVPVSMLVLMEKAQEALIDSWEKQMCQQILRCNIISSIRKEDSTV